MAPEFRLSDGENNGGDGCCYTPGGGASPIILDLSGEGFHLTDAQHGVLFQVFPDVQTFYLVAWPARGSDDAWLVLDRDGDGTIDDFGEMFGNLTDQPDPPPGQQRNGFLALAVFDRPEYGGNGDGWISKEDAIFSQLRIWQDKNHNGISEPEELHTLESAGIKAISLNDRLSERVDEFGNRFRYRAAVRDANDSEVGKVAYDVFPVLASDPSPTSTPAATVGNGEQRF